jgi:small-conductance mechanosensitive channel
MSGAAEGEKGVQRLLDRDFLSALVLLVIGTIALSQAGSDRMNWIFPRLAAYVVLASAAFLFAKVAWDVVRNRAADRLTGSSGDLVVFRDLAVFGAIVLVFMFVMYGLGFWLAALLMLSATSIYLTLDKTPRNVAMAIIVPACCCVVAYVVFLHVFYVPLPEARWWAGFR